MPVIPPIDSDAVLWNVEPAEREGRPLLLLLHGYGSNEADLFGLVPYLPEQFAIASVRAPLPPPFPTPGHSWYPIEGLFRPDPVTITEAAERLVEWVDEVAPGAPVGLLGFSQGASVSIQALRVAPERFSFALAIAGYASPGEHPGDAALAERKPPLFWGRGSHDEVIPAPLIAHTTEWLPTHVDLSGRVYPGLAHSISEQELADMRVFLDKQLERLG